MSKLIHYLNDDEYKEIATFDAAYNRTGLIVVVFDDKCDVCNAGNVPVLSIDSSSDEYGPGSVCSKCLAKIVLELEVLETFELEEDVNKKMKITDYLKIADAAKFLGVTTNTLRNWDKEKKIKVYRNPQNRYRLYRKEDLEELLNNIE